MMVLMDTCSLKVREGIKQNRTLLSCLIFIKQSNNSIKQKPMWVYTMHFLGFKAKIFL